MTTRRTQEAVEVRRADKAAMIGRLMLGEVHDLQDLFAVDERDYVALPRRALRSGKRDVRGRLSTEIKRFASSNFENVSALSLARLYDDALPSLREVGVYAIPLPEFERRYSRVRDTALKGTPRYATAVLSVRGLQFQFPEQQLSGDILTALEQLSYLAYLPTQTADEVDLRARRVRFASRSLVAASFNLMEAFLNGMLWTLIQTGPTRDDLTRKQRDMIDEPTSANLRSKLQDIPILLTGSPLPPSPELDRLLGSAKRYRDSLTHPSPFVAPSAQGGYDKLDHFYAIDPLVALPILTDCLTLMGSIASHAGGGRPQWLVDLHAVVDPDSIGGPDASG